MAKRDLMISVRVSRNYGAHSVQFGLAENIGVNNGAERRDAYANLLSQLDDQIRIYEDVYLPETRLPMQNNSDSLNVVPNLDKFLAHTILVESKSGKRYVSVKGGRWSKHGVPIYPECITDIPHESYDFGEHDISHLELTATVDIENGSPKRTVSIK